MNRLLAGSLAVLFVLCAFQWHSLRGMKAEVEELRRSRQLDARTAVAKQFTADAHDEVQRALTWLDDYYRSPEGLGRANGLCTGGTLDAAEVTGRLFDSYLRLRIEGSSEGAARDTILQQLQATGEWHAAHPGT